MGRETIAIHVVAGFLDAGKTTRIIVRCASELGDALVLVNERGAIGADHFLEERLSGAAILIGGWPQAAAKRPTSRAFETTAQNT